MNLKGKPVHLTHHVRKRMNERGISRAMIKKTLSPEHIVSRHISGITNFIRDMGKGKRHCVVMRFPEQVVVTTFMELR